MKKMYAMYICLEKGEFHMIHHTFGVDSEIDEYFDTQMHDLEEEGVRLVRSLITSDLGLHLKSRLKWKVRELKNTHRGCVEFYHRLRSLTSDEVLLQCAKTTQVEREEILISQVAELVRRMFELDLEVSDELALSCFNYRQVVPNIPVT